MSPGHALGCGLQGRSYLERRRGALVLRHITLPTSQSIMDVGWEPTTPESAVGT